MQIYPKIRSYLISEYRRVFPYFSLCGLACGLCPHFNTQSTSACPGCGGQEFHRRHPSCAVISCNRRHDGVEYCVECSEYPCGKYQAVSEKDSFITYKHVLDDFTILRDTGADAFQEMIVAKMAILRILLAEYNDGRKKNFYCLAVTLIPLSDLEQLMHQVRQSAEIPMQKERAGHATAIFRKYSEDNGITLALRR